MFSRMELVSSSLSSLNDNDQIMVLFVKVNAGLQSSKPLALSKYLWSTLDLIEPHLWKPSPPPSWWAQGILDSQQVEHLGYMLTRHQGLAPEQEWWSSNWCQHWASCCIGLKLAGNHFVHYKFKEASPPQKESMHPLFTLLIQAQTCHASPGQYNNPCNFPLNIYNFRIDDLVKGNFSIQFLCDVKDKVATLVLQWCV
jgi:hypothetical protein